jgi:hypothetical protein
MIGSDPVSPTAHYTGYVWARHGLSHPELQTVEGRVMFETLRPLIKVTRELGGGSLESYLLTRHRAIDVLLERAIEERGITQVLEVACGLSPRGWRFTERYGDRITYVESDLPEMAARKRAALERMGSLSDHHRVVELDALKDTGPQSLTDVTGGLDPGRGLAIVTEGLLGYLPSEAVLDLWHRFADTLAGFNVGSYVSDLHMGCRTTRCEPSGCCSRYSSADACTCIFRTPPRQSTCCATAAFRLPASTGPRRWLRRPGALAVASPIYLRHQVIRFRPAARR